MISFWAKVISSNALRLSMIMYNIVYSNYNFSNRRHACFKLMDNIRNTLNMCGFSGIWDSHSFPTVKWLVKAVKQKLIDNFTTKWFSDVYTSSSSLNYRIFKTNFAFEKYLVSLPPKFYKPLLMIRTRNHHLPIETGRWHQIVRTERTCHLCNAEIGDEYRYIMTC